MKNRLFIVTTGGNTMNDKYNVEDDEYYQKHVAKPSINENTAKKYKKVLTKFCRATNKTLGEIINSCIDEQNVVTTIELPPDEKGNKRKREIRFDINSKDALINKYLNQYITYCKNRNNKNITINRELGDIKAFLKGHGVILPKIEQLEDDSAEWTLLSKEDFNYILQDTTLVHQSLANFLISTGMRIGDALSWSISDFMNATSDYHDFVDVEDFIDNAPDDMIGTWEFIPSKTKKDKIKCITFNSAHTSNLILQNLRHIKNQYLPYKNKKDNVNLKISKKDALFGARNTAYKEPISAKSVADQWYKKNQKFKAWKISQIKQQIKNGELSEEDFDEAVEKIPKFHAHICRKFFITTVGNNCGDIRTCALLEGHSGGLPTDKSYVKKSVEDIKEIYINNIHDELSLNKVETKIVTNKETEELNKKMEALRNENEDLKNQVKEINQNHQEEVAQLNIEMGDLRKEMKQNIEVLEAYKEARNLNAKMKNIIVNPELDLVIKKYYADHHDLGGRYLNLEEQALCKLAYDEAIDEDDFEATEKNIETLFDIVEVRCNLNPDLLTKTIRIMQGVPDEALENIIDEISNWIIIQPKLLKMAGGNPIRIQTVVQKYVLSNPEIEDKIQNITDNNKNKIIEEIMVECVKFNAQK